MTVSKECISIFKKSIEDYHILDSVDQEFKNPFSKNEVFKKNIYKKSWIDTVQWHLEDIIRKPSINPNKALKIKRRIDESNQNRTDMVEAIDDYFFSKFSGTSRSNNSIDITWYYFSGIIFFYWKHI